MYTQGLDQSGKEERGARGEEDGIEVLRVEQQELEERGIFHPHN